MKQVLKKLLLTLTVTVIALLGIAIPVFADALYTGTLQVTNNSTATTNVATVFTLNAQSMIDNGFAESDFSDVSVTYNSVPMPFMPGSNSTNPWCLFVPTIGTASINYMLQSGGATGGLLYYFPGSTGLNCGDPAGLEFGANGELRLTNTRLITDSGDLFFSHADPTNGGIMGFNDGGTVTAAVVAPNYAWASFSTDNWTDVNTGITVSTTDSRINYLSDYSATDRRTYYDTTLQSNTTWRMDFTLRNTAKAGVVPAFSFGIFSAATNFNGYAGDSIGFRMYDAPGLTAVIFRHDGGAVAYSGGISLNDNTTYYCTLTRNTAILATLNIYTDVARTTQAAGSPVTLAIPATVTTLRYIQATNDNSGAGAGNYLQGWIDTLTVSSMSVAVSAATSEYDTAVSVTGGNLTLEVGASTASKASAAVPNSNAVWTIGKDVSTTYMETVEIDVSGVPVSAWDWEYGTTFQDSIGANDATASIRTTSSDADVTAELISFEPTDTSELESFSFTGDLPDIGTPESPTQMYTEGTYDKIPGADSVNEMLGEGGVPYALWWYPFIYFSICIIGLIVYGATQGPMSQKSTSNPFDGSLLIMAVAMEVLIVLFGIMNPVPLWPAYLFPIPALAIISSRKHTSIG